VLSHRLIITADALMTGRAAGARLRPLP